MTIIGPTECDSEREEREKELNDVWNNLVSSYAYLKTHTVLTEAIDLFRESLSCYQNGAYKATSIMCRSSTECAVYLAVTRRNFKYHKPWQIIHKSDSVSIKDDKWETLVKKGKEIGILDKDIIKILKQIRARGNFIAHYGSIMDKTLLKFSKDVTAPTTRSRERKRNDIMSQLIFDKKTALDNLVNTQTVLKFLIEKILSKSHPS